MLALSRDEIRKVACPDCGAVSGQKCLHTGKGALKKTRKGVNHAGRMQAAQEIAEDLIEDIVLIDYGDIF